MKFNDIKQMARSYYRVHMNWSYMVDWIFKERSETCLADMDPVYQRGYVWSDEQKTQYIEYCLKGGTSGREIYWNCSSWMNGFDSPIEIVDGKQRINAALEFLDNKVSVFGGNFINDFEDKRIMLRGDAASFFFNVNELKDPECVIQWYIDMNTGGSVHTETDLAPAYKALEELQND